MAKTNLQKVRGCLHGKVVWTKEDHPKYGAKVPYFVKSVLEINCDGSCGGRRG